MFQKPKGTKDLFGFNANAFNLIRKTFFEVCENFNFHYIETPIFESANLFRRTSGEASDIVTKEMYIFNDKAGREMALKPEGTAPIIRAIIENRLYANSNLKQKYFYFTPTFRYEQPQKGRQRQFYQAGVEFLTNANPYSDLEVLLLGIELLNKLQINDYVLKINSLGDANDRSKYSKFLKKYFMEYHDKLQPISQQRLAKNPLRILDDKVEITKDFVQQAPKIQEFLNASSVQNFNLIRATLDKMGIKYEYDPNLVRGLDYYDDLVFEFVSTSPALGSQATILAGGRYNSLIAELGGPEQSAIGFGCGVERLLEIMSFQHEKYQQLALKLDFYVASFNEAELFDNLVVIQQLRASGFKVESSKVAEKLKTAFKNATNIANFIIFKELDQKDGEIMVKSLTDNSKYIIKKRDLINEINKIV